MNSRASHWLQLIAFTGGTQVLVQAISLASGVLIIRLLPIHEYAMYTIANTMLGTMTILADGGIANGVMAEGGRIWRDKKKLGVVVATGMALRKKFAFFSLMIATPILLALLRKNEASWITALLITFALIPAFFSSLSTTLLQVPPKLHQEVRPMQGYQIEANTGRLAVSAVTLIFLPYAALAIVCAGLSQYWNNWRLRKLSEMYSDPASSPDSHTKERILAIVKRVMPEAIFFCISGQITVWLASVFNTTKTVAELGALGRLTAVFGAISAVIAIIVIPRFSRMQSSGNLVVKRFLQLQLICILLAASIVVGCWIFSSQVLFVLGKSYFDLNHELVLAVAAASVTFVYGITFSICLNRGHVIRPLVSIAVTAVAQTFLVYLVGYSSLDSILRFSLATSLVQYVMWTIFFFSKEYQKTR